MLKKTILFLSLFFLGRSVEARPLERLAFFGKITHDVVLFYINHMITVIAHEFGHAMVYWFNDVPTRIVINANKKRIRRNYRRLKAEEKAGYEKKIPLPSFEINPIPSFYSVCIPTEELTGKQMILCAVSGPLAGAATSLLLAGLLPAPYLFEDNISMTYFWTHLANLIPFNLFGIKSDGYHIVEQLGVL